MNADTGFYRPQQGYIKNTVLVLIAFAIAFFPRIINAAGAPAAINFVHFAVLPVICGIVLFTTRVKNKKQISITKMLISGLMILLGVMTASALVNKAGMINVFVGFMLLAEPFILLLTIISIPYSLGGFKRFRGWIIGFITIHMFLALSQYFLLERGILKLKTMTEGDNVQGVFYLSGGGHVVSASVLMSFGLYYFISSKNVSIFMRGGYFFGCFLVLLFADAKQVLFVFLAAWVLLILISSKDIKLTLQYVIGGIIMGSILYWCIYHLEVFSPYKTWIRPEIYGPNGDATILKTTPLRIIPTYYKSFLNWFVGLGPGHTIGRLGGWMLVDYWNLLGPLGATIHPCSQVIWDIARGQYLDSSFFSPFWGWAAIWGDSGILGLAAYLYLASIVWYRLCLDSFSKFMMLTVIVNGFIFTLMEEPGYMLSIATLIGLRWQEQRITNANSRL